MRKIITSILLTLSTFSALASEIKLDTIYIIGKPEPILGLVNINYKKKVVHLYDSAGKRMDKTDFAQISHIHCGNGNSYVRRDSQGKSLILMQLIVGKYSLLHDKGTGTYFIDKNDTLKVLSKSHFKRALPLIFTNVLLETFHRESNLRPDYSSKYFRRLVHFANRDSGVSEVMNHNNISDLRLRFFIGPYSGYSISKTSFIEDIKHPMTFEYARTGSYRAMAVPFGFRTRAELDKKLGFEVATYLNNATIKHFGKNNSDFFDFFYIRGYRAPKEFKYPVGLQSYTFTTLNFDVSINYAFRLRVLSKFKANLFLGPCMVILMDSNVKIYTQFISDDKIDRYYTSHLNKASEKDLMVGAHGGVGMDYKFTDRFAINFSAKYQAGIFTKVESRTRNINNVSDGHSPVGSLGAGIVNQPVQQLQVVGSAFFKLW